MARAEPAPVRAVTFDFWGTLARDTRDSLDRARTMRLEGLRTVLAHAGCARPSAAIEEAYERCGVEMTRRFWDQDRDVGIEQQIRLFLECVEPGLANGLGRHFASAVDAYVTPALRWPPALVPGSGRAVRVLAERGLALAIISNTGRTPGAVLRRILADYGLLRHFTTVSYSDEMAVRKPDPSIFKRTLEALGGVDPALAVHVGDSAVDDVLGARGAGMRAVHISASGRPPSPDADLVIDDLGELPERLVSLTDGAGTR